VPSRGYRIRSANRLSPLTGPYGGNPSYGASALERAAEAGDVRSNIDPGDIMPALAGVTYGAANSGWQASALRLMDLLMDGLAWGVIGERHSPRGSIMMRWQTRRDANRQIRPRSSPDD
jgi:hypothetical protein